MSKFHSIKVSDIYKETKDCSVITFDIPDSLKEEFKFKQGQHLSFRTKIDGIEVRRTYSMYQARWKINGRWQLRK